MPFLAYSPPRTIPPTLHSFLRSRKVVASYPTTVIFPFAASLSSPNNMARRFSSHHIPYLPPHFQQEPLLFTTKNMWIYYIRVAKQSHLTIFHHFLLSFQLSLGRYVYVTIGIQDSVCLFVWVCQYKVSSQVWIRVIIHCFALSLGFHLHPTTHKTTHHLRDHHSSLFVLFVYIHASCLSTLWRNGSLKSTTSILVLLVPSFFRSFFSYDIFQVSTLFFTR